MAALFSSTNMNLDQGNDVSISLDSILKEDELRYTPDMPDLCRWTGHHVFVYGTLKHGFKRSEMMHNATPVGVGYTKSNHFELSIYEKTANAKVFDQFPVALVNVNGNRSARLYGEVYQVKTDRLVLLDEVESNGVFFKRVRLPFDIQCLHDQKVHQMYCFVYLGVKAFWSTKTDALRACDILKANTNSGFTYYNYMKKYELEA